MILRDLPENPRILVITLRRIGDVLLTTPLMHVLRARWPGGTVDALVFRGTEGILSGNPDVGSVLTLSRRPRAAEVARLVASIWRRYDVAISTQTGDRPTLLAFAAGRRRVGLIDAAETGARWKRHLIQDRVPVKWGNHRVSELMRLAASLGIAGNARIVCPQGSGGAPRPERTYAVVHANPMFRYRRWTHQGWRAVVEGLIKRGLPVVATGGPDVAEKAYLDALFDESTPVERLDGRLDWPQLASLLGGAAVFVGPDTSVTHLAAASGCPTVALYGPENPCLMGPWPADGPTPPWERAGTIQRRANVWVVQHPLPCLPCERVGCENHVESFSRCLDELPASRVLAAVDQALASAPVPSA